jgi:NAD(P)-dependent dehydrogenase (short-subunit alcohol dehydrogenase family)
MSDFDGAGRLAGKVAVITGAASGIGLASARLFAAEGARVLAVDLPGERLEAAFAGVGNPVALGLSVTGADAPDRIAEAVGAHFGQLDILFNNAGVASSILAASLDDAEWDRVVDVNLRAAFRITRGLIPLLVKSPAGRIINTASVMAQGTDWGLAAYCASKAGLEGLTRTLALELGKQGVTANCILPGAIRTGMTGGLWDARPDVADIWAKKSVLRRLGEPADIARAALFLASDDSAFITGQSLAVDGGLRLRI